MVMYSTLEASEKLGLSEKIIIRMCRKEIFKGAYQTVNGNWLIPADNFITDKDHDKKVREFLKDLDEKNKKAGTIDEFDL